MPKTDLKPTTREEREWLRDNIVDSLYHSEHYDTDPPKELSELVLRLIADVERLRDVIEEVIQLPDDWSIPEDVAEYAVPDMVRRLRKALNAD